MLRRYANKSRVKVLTQTIIGKYLCPGSRAEKAEKITGGRKEKKKSCVKVFTQTTVGATPLARRRRKMRFLESIYCTSRTRPFDLLFFLKAH